VRIIDFDVHDDKNLVVADVLYDVAASVLQNKKDQSLTVVIQLYVIRVQKHRYNKFI
jgi:hypothetical protein